MSDTRTTAGLRQPLLIRMCGGVCTVRLVFCRFVYLPRGADAPRSWLQHDRSPVEKHLLRCTNAHYQERRASARRGFGNRACNGDRLSRGEHVSTVDPARTSHNRESQLISGNRQPTGAAGVSPPWFANRACNGDRLSRGMIAFLAHDRHQATDGEQGKHSGG
jgi:hypothetical protein